MRTRSTKHLIMKPDYLKRGDLIALMAPSRKVKGEDYKLFATYLKKQGFRLCFPDDIETADHQFAGSDEHRSSKLNNMFNNPLIKAVIMIRGGYGAARIVDMLDWDAFTRKPKWLCGFSDATVFLNHAFESSDVASLHCDMPMHFENPNYDRENFEAMIRVIQGESIEYSFDIHPLNRGEKAEGVLVGGNLSVLYSLMGSASFPDMDGKILLLEDIDEYLYHIDRMMLALDRAGKLKNLKGLIVGGFTDMNDNEVPFGKTAEEIIADRVSKYDYPLFFNIPVGHTKTNKPLIIGSKISIEKSSEKLLLKQN